MCENKASVARLLGVCVQILNGIIGRSNIETEFGSRLCLRLPVRSYVHVFAGKNTGVLVALAD